MGLKWSTLAKFVNFSSNRRSVNNDWLPGIWIDNEIILDFKVVSRSEKEIPDWFRKANPIEVYSIKLNKKNCARCKL